MWRLASEFTPHVNISKTSPALACRRDVSAQTTARTVTVERNRRTIARSDEATREVRFGTGDRT